MAWRVRRHNQLTGGNSTAPTNYPNAAAAFDAALDNVGAFIKARIASGLPGNEDGPPADNHRFKIYVDYRAGRGLQFELRYDYPTGTLPDNPEGTWETNSLYWRIVEV